MQATELEITECVADIVGIELLLAAQALDLRMRGIGFDASGEPMDVLPVVPAPKIAEVHAIVRQSIEYWEDDGVLHPALVQAGQLVRTGAILNHSGPW